MENIVITLKEQWNQLKEEQPKLRIRDAAKQLGVSEAQLLQTGLSEQNILLKNEFKEILKDLAPLGEVMALTRNDYCVHERKGVYTKVSFNGHVGLVVTPDIDLRLFMSQWRTGFAVNENNRLSLQFFDAEGTAVHKVYLTGESDEAAYHQLVEKYKDENQNRELIFKVADHPVAEKPDAEVNTKGFTDAWKNLQDTHEFHGLLKQYELSRTQALRLAPEGFATKISLDALKNILNKAASEELPIMVFTGNPGCIQIHTGAIKNIVQTGPWFNVLDPKFNMHLREDGIANIWLVKKPTTNGFVHSLEVYDQEGNTIVQFFGKRKPGIPELSEWRDLVSN